MATIWEDIKEISIAAVETLTDYAKDFYQAIRDGWFIIFLLAAALTVTISFANPPPPKEVYLLSGPKETTYYQLAQEYSKELAKNGITVHVVETKGFEENLTKIKDEKDITSQIGFIVADSDRTDRPKNISSLGSIQYAPLWFFYKGDPKNYNSFDWVANKKVYIGNDGTATQYIAHKILSLTGLEKEVQTMTMPYSQLFDAVKNNETNAVFITDQPDAKIIQFLNSQPDWHLTNSFRLDAFIKIMPYLHKLKVPEGSLNLKLNKPEQDTYILAGTIDLVIKNNLHPAIQMLFMEASKKINGQRTFFSAMNEFPSYTNDSFTESKEAKIYYERGLPKLMGYMPFWLAEMINRLIFYILPFLVVAYPIIKSLPGLKTKRSRTHIGKAYKRLKEIEHQINETSEPNLQAYLNEIDGIEADLKSLKISSKLHSDYFNLLSAIDFLRNYVLNLADIRYKK